MMFKLFENFSFFLIIKLQFIIIFRFCSLISIPSEICKNSWNKRENSCYKYYNFQYNFAIAEYICNAFGSHVVSIHNNDEMFYILNDLR